VECLECSAKCWFIPWIRLSNSNSKPTKTPWQYLYFETILHTSVLTSTPSSHISPHAQSLNYHLLDLAFSQGGIISKIRRRLTVQGDSETLDGGALADLRESKGKAEDVSHRLEPYYSSCLSIVFYLVSHVRLSHILLFCLRARSVSVQHHGNIKCAVTEYSGVTKKGHAPYNPRKKNQDALIMADDPSTNTLILCVLDGHGEHGDGVSAQFRDQLAMEMMSHPSWSTDIKKAVADSIAKVEHQVIRNFRIDTEFSGTTLSMAIIRGNKLIGVNIGDSRVILGLEKDGEIVAEEFTHDHKPDSPLEKERILAAGGRVFAVEYDDGIDGPPRVWLGHMDVPGLAMSRLVGTLISLWQLLISSIVSFFLIACMYIHLHRRHYIPQIAGGCGGTYRWCDFRSRIC
jgi:hypothetical protein